MSDDELAIRELIANWNRATSVGDAAPLMKLMAEDVVFLTPGHPPMRGRDGFQAAFQAALKRFRIDPVSEVQEIQIAGDLAYCWTYITVTMTPINGGAAARRSGDTLTILRKQAGGAWMIARDANMLTAAA